MKRIQVQIINLKHDKQDKIGKASFKIIINL
jgi:hypothetical protein